MKKSVFSLLIISVIAVENLQSMNKDIRNIIIEHVKMNGGINQPIVAWANQLSFDVALENENCRDLIPMLLDHGPKITSRTLAKAILAAIDSREKPLNMINPFVELIFYLPKSHSQDEIRKMIDDSKALSLAAEHGDAAIVDTLMVYKPNINIIDDMGLTPLHQCVSLELVKNGEELERKRLLIGVLCAYGADPSQKDAFGRSPAQYARELSEASSSELYKSFLMQAIFEFKRQVQLKKAQADENLQTLKSKI